MFAETATADIDAKRRTVATSWIFWAVFAIWQALGVWIPRFTNIHSNIWPLFAGLMLVPGIAIPFVFDFLPFRAGMTMGVLVMAGSGLFSPKLGDDRK